MTTGLLVSQIGYPPERPATVFWRSDTLSEPPDLTADGEHIAWQSAGASWGSYWWQAAIPAEGCKVRKIVAGDFCETLEFEPNVLWEKSWRATSYQSLGRRSHIAKNNRGWLDCGSHWQEANSHACCILGLTDLLEFAAASMTAEEAEQVREQIRVGLDLLEWYQDLAAELPGGKGALVHEVPCHAEALVPADVSKAATAFARAARFTTDPDKARNWRERAAAACEWLARAEPSGPTGFCHEAHGVPAGTEVPKDFMTRDLLMELWALIELAHMDQVPLPARAHSLAKKILARQFEARPEGCQYDGQFATFDCEVWPRPELAWTHYLGKGRLGNDVGATYAHWLVPLIRITEWWPDDDLCPAIREAIRRFAYGYFLPACRANPFGILPIGEFPGEGLIWFAGLWHGMNSTYGLAASLAWEFARFLDDAAFLPLIDGNLQWIAGLNGGIHPGVEIGCEMSTPDLAPGRYLPVSMIYGVGRRYFGAWKTIRGSFGSGFCTGKSFHFDVSPTAANDAPSSFADEDWITFNGAWLGALARLQTQS